MKTHINHTVVIILVIMCVQVNYSQWIHTGLDSVDVNSFAVSGNHFYAGSYSSGVFLSINNGSSWTDISAYKNQTDLMVDKFGFLYTSPSGYFSTNYGASWSYLHSAFIQRTVLIDGDNIYAGSEWNEYGSLAQILKSSDFGIHWTTVYSLGHNMDGIYSLAKKGDTLLASATYLVYFSTDDGKTWNSYEGLPDYSLVSINGNNFYDNSGYGIYCSSNGGTQWSAINNGLKNSCVYKLLFWGNNIFSATYAGVFQSTNNGADWFDVSTGLNNQKVGSLIIKGDTLFAGTQHGVWYRTLSEILDVKTEKPALPTQFVLKQNYPNPFNPSTTISYSLAKEGIVKLSVFSALGSNVATILNEYKPAGEYSVQFNASNLPSGIYLYRIHSGSFVDTKKMILVK